MAKTDLTLGIKATGTEAAQRALANVARSVEAMKTSLQPNAGASSAWNPYIATLKQVEARQIAAAESAKKTRDSMQPNSGAASAWNPYISELQRLSKAQHDAEEAARKHKAQIQPNSGAASAWNPYISAVNQLKAAQDSAAESARRLAEANQKAQSAGLASAWSPEISRGRQMQQSAQDQALGRTSALVPVGGRLHNLNQSIVEGQAAAQDRYGALTDATTNYGRTALLIGGGGSYALGKSAMDAGNLAQTRKSIESYEGGKELYQGLVQFDKSSPMDLREVLSQGQSSLAQDFKSSEIIPMFNTLGDAVVKAGGSTQEFSAAMVQIAQIKNKGVASMQDIKALAEGAKLPIIPILKEALGAERVKGILSGDDPIGAEELFQHMFEGLKKRSGGAMQEYMDTLPGALGELESSAFMLRTEMGEHLVPTMKLGVDILKGVTGAFRAVPAPIQKIIALGGGLVFGLTAVAGATASVISPLLQLYQTITLLKNAKAAGTVSTASAGGVAAIGGVASGGASAAADTAAVNGNTVATNANTAAKTANTGATSANATSASNAAASKAVLTAADNANAAAATGSAAAQTAANAAVQTSTIQTQAAAEGWGTLTLAQQRSAAASAAAGNAASMASAKMTGAAAGVSLLSRGLMGLQALVIPAIMIPLGTMVIDAVNDAMGGKKGSDARADTFDAAKGDFDPINTRAGQGRYATELKAIEKEATDRVYDKRMPQAESDKKLLDEKIDLERRYADEFSKYGSVGKAAADERRKKYNELVAQRDSARNVAVVPTVPTIPVTTASLPGAAPIMPNLATDGAADYAASLEGEIESLKRQARNTDKDHKKALQDQIFEKGIALKHARAAAAKLKSENKAQEKEQKEALKASIEESRYNLDVKSTETEEGFNTRLAQLEAQRDAAQQAKDEAKAAQYKFEIDKLQAERDYALAKINADAAGLEDEKKRDSMLRIAEAKRKGALERATIAFGSARTKVGGAVQTGANGILARLPVGLQTRGLAFAGNSGGVFNPYANARYEGDGFFTRMLGQGGAYNESARAARDYKTEKIKHKMTRLPNGKRRYEFEPIEIDDGVQDMGGRL